MTDPLFHPLSRADFERLRRWLAQPHVARWWHHGTAPEDIEADFGPTLDGAEPGELFIVSAGAQPVGFLQRYRLADYPDYAAELAPWVDVPPGAYSIDYFIGEPDALRRGWGSAMIAAALQGIWRDLPGVDAVLVAVHDANVASWRALERAGFRLAASAAMTPDNPADDDAHRIYRIDRSAPFDASALTITNSPGTR